MKTITLYLFASFLLITLIHAGSLDWGNPSTNNAVLNWTTWTNGPVLRYTAFWTPLTNLDTGTNYAQTTNWTQFVDVNSSTTSAPMSTVPTNTWVTWIVIVPGGQHTIPINPYCYTNPVGITVTNQPAYP